MDSFIKNGHFYVGLSKGPLLLLYNIVIILYNKKDYLYEKCHYRIKKQNISDLC